MAASRSSSDLPAAGDVAMLVDDTGFSEDEREEIEREIAELVSESRTKVSPNDPSLRPKRSGVLFPIIINLFAAAAVVGGIYFLSWYFQDRESNITIESQQFLSTEGQLLQQALRESEEQLAAKEAEISDIQARLAQVAEERENLEENLESELSAREAQLRAELEAELEAERRRLAEAGQSEAQIEAQLQALEAERQQELDQTLAAVRAEAQAELAARQERLNELGAELEQTLEASRAERERLVAEAAEREAEIRAELGAEIEALEEASAEAQARLQQLQQQQEDAALVADRVYGSFRTIIGQIEAENTEGALASLSSLESLLLRSATTLADSERETQLELVGTLRQLVRDVDRLEENLALRQITTTEEQQRRVEQERAAEMISAAGEVIELAGEAAGAGRYNEARTLYQQALETIPSLDEVYPGILTLEAERRSTIMETAVAEAQALLDQGRSDAAITTYLEALRELADDQSDPLLDVAAGIAVATEANQQAMLDAQTELASRLRGQIDDRDGRISDLNQRLLQAQNTISGNQTTIASLEGQIDELEQQVEQQTRTLAVRASALSEAQAQARALDDQLADLRTDLSEEEARAESLRAQLTAAREEAAAAASTAQTRIRELERTMTSLRAERDAQADQVEVLAGQIDTLEETLQTERARTQASEASLEAQIRGLEQELTAAESQARSLQTSLEEARAAREEAQARATDEEVQALEAQVVSLRTDRDAQADQVATLRSQIASLETQLEEERAAAADQDRVATLESQLRTMEQDLTASQSEVQRLQTELDAATSDLEESRHATSAARAELQETQDELQAELDAASERVTSLQERVTSLATARETAEAQAEALQTELDAAQTTLETLQTVSNTVGTLRDTYQANLARANTLSRDGDLSDLTLARTQLLESLQSSAGREILPGFVDSLQELDRQINDAEISSARAGARERALEDVVSFTTFMQERVDEADDSAEIDRRVARLDEDDPGLARAAQEIRELVALANRGISAAPSTSYRLLGSVSRVLSGDQLVVERLVALEAQVGDQVQIRRSQGLGEETTIATGTITETDERRVLVRIDEVDAASATPTERDLVYVVSTE